ncbi:MAG: class I SAM-dependent rRNA methyltransferase [Solobacterium sp.]|nr:class I SAM-dependent rRNA methyltransferase [Solobacterium sp.]
MLKNRQFPYVRITEKQERTVRAGHPWIYEDEITESSGEIENGSLVDVYSRKDRYLGTGLISHASKIRIRLLGSDANETYGDPFFERKVKYALQYRRDIMKEDMNACRLIHGEADGLPGLTVDRYGPVLVSEVASYGIDQRKDVIYKALKEHLEGIEGIYERNEGELRLKEGLPQYKGWYGEIHPQNTVISFTENGIQYEADIENGQKTGFFLDQKYNRLAVRRAAEGKTVLDCCTHTGSFALNAAKGGALSVTAADISETALAMTRKNAERNGVSLKTIQGDVFDLLPKLREEHAFFDFIVLDPPAFTKSSKTFRSARAGYRQINAMAMRLLPRGGYLATCSCSHFMPKEEFRMMLKDAALDAGVGIRIVEERGAAPDHPVLPAVPQTEYLKFFLLQII